MNNQSFFTYILACADGTFYTGWTTDVEKRVAIHNRGKGAKYTRTRLPVKLLGSWRFQNKSEAMKFEAWVKTLPRPAKEALLKKPAREPLPASGHVLPQQLPRL